LPPDPTKPFNFLVTKAEGFLISGPKVLTISFANGSGALAKKSALPSSNTPHDIKVFTA